MPRARTFRPACELLEPRLALSADLTAVAVSLGGEVTWIHDSETKLAVVPGQELAIVGALIDVTDDLVSTGGVLQMEGYLRSGDGAGGLGEFDYTQGRFSSALTVDEAAIDEVHAGLSGGWTIDALHNRLSIVLVHYVGDAVATTDRFFLQLQTYMPDYGVTGGAVESDNREIKVGQMVDIRFELTNSGDAVLPWYVEGDVYHESDLTTPVWVGTFVATDKSKGKLVNDNDSDSFSKHWHPDRAGRYLIKLYVDPEQQWLEGTEDNNVFSFWITVGGK
jgi:hypothetical protein